MTATTWQHGGWRRMETARARRDELILHIEEVEAALAGYSFVGGLGGQQARRFELERYRETLSKELRTLEDRIGIGDYAYSGPRFVSLRPGR